MPNFAIFDSLSDALTEIPITEIVESAVDSQHDTIVDLNVDQMDEGQRADGTEIKPEYRPKTISRKKKMGQPYDRVTLKDSGDFHNSVRVKKYVGMLELIAQDWKSEHLQDKYGPMILGLTDNHISLIRYRIKPIILEDVKSSVKKRMR